MPQHSVLSTQYEILPSSPFIFIKPSPFGIYQIFPKKRIFLKNFFCNIVGPQTDSGSPWYRRCLFVYGLSPRIRCGRYETFALGTCPAFGFLFYSASPSAEPIQVDNWDKKLSAQCKGFFMLGEFGMEEYEGIKDPYMFLIRKLESIEKRLIDIEAKADLRTYTLKQIAERYGHTVQTMYNCPWKKPNFGKSDVQEATPAWYHDTIVNWFARPEEERRFEWESMSNKERLQALGKVKKDVKKTKPDRATGLHIVKDGSMEKAG
jgi:hypothetical protein